MDKYRANDEADVCRAKLINKSLMVNKQYSGSLGTNDLTIVGVLEGECK